MNTSRPTGVFNRLEAAGVRLPRLGVGTAPLGGLFEPVTAEDARHVIDLAFDAGVAYFDTAPLYGLGVAETRLGEALAGRSRDSFVVSTKVGRVLRAEVDEHSAAAAAVFKTESTLNAVFDFSTDGVRRSLNESLERLGLDYVDVAFVHDPDDDYDTALHESIPALVDLRAQGLVRAIGVGMNQSALLARFAEEAPIDAVLLAGRYTLLDQSALGDLLPVCEQHQIAVIIGGVFNSGILADPNHNPRFDYAAAPLHIVRQAKRIQHLCRQHGVPLTAAAVQFPLGHPAIRSILTGVRSPAELHENIDMFNLSIPSPLWEALAAEGLVAVEAPRPAGTAA